MTTPSSDVAPWVLARLARLGDDRRAKEKWLSRVVGIQPELVLGSDNAADDDQRNGHRPRPPRRRSRRPFPGLPKREGAREKATG